jgi:hypothetical protein
MNWKGFSRKRPWPNCKLLSQHSPGETEENCGNHNQESRHPGRDLNRGPPEYEAEVVIC